MKSMQLFICLAFVAGQVFSQECNYRVNSEDPSLGISQKKMAYETWFRTYDPELKSGGENKNVIGRVSLGNLSGSKELNFSVEVKSMKADKIYGQIGVGYPIKVIIDGGEIIELKAREADPGQVDAKMKSTTYETSYRLTDEEFEKFKSTPVKKLRIFWSESKFTDHDADFPEVLMHQAKCL